MNQRGGVGWGAAHAMHTAPQHHPGGTPASGSAQKHWRWRVSSTNVSCGDYDEDTWPMENTECDRAATTLPQHKPSHGRFPGGFALHTLPLLLMCWSISGCWCIACCLIPCCQSAVCLSLHPGGDKQMPVFLQWPSGYLLLPFWLLLKAKGKTRIAEWDLIWHLKYFDTEWQNKGSKPGFASDHLSWCF